MSAPIRHELIRASAGTGKTYQLANRYLHLLFLSGAPEKIIALTFTRKAAGEFFEKIFHRLACAAEDPAQAAGLGRELGLPVTQALCLQHLRLMLERLHRLQLSTYDRFFARIVQAFPFELGLAASPTMLDDNQRQEAILRTQQNLLRIEEGHEERLQEFWQAFKRATMGREEKRMSELVDDYILQNQSLYFDAPQAALWGDPERIWPEGYAWRTEQKTDTLFLSRELRAVLPWSGFTAQQRADWELFLSDLADWHPPAAMPDSVKKFAGKFLEAIEELRGGAARITVRKKQELGKEECRTALEIAVYCMNSELLPRLEATQGLFQLIRLFEAIYREEVRGLGRLTIEDMTRLLSGEVQPGKGLESEDFRLGLDYRLDSSFDHWLLDEFQDTSHSQWRAVENLLDEVLQDGEGRRSFFAVGDTKQSLYMWRGSDDRLFDRIQERYEHAISVRKLDVSYRSAKPVLELVNETFSQTEALAEIVGGTAAERWARMWTTHRPAARLETLPGHACWLLVEKEDEGRRETLLRLLRTLDPLARGQSVAILTQTNGEAEELVDFIRANTDFACSLAAEVHPGADNPASAGLRSLLTVALHPSDMLAWRHLLMTPLAAQVQALGKTASLLSDALRERLARGGLSEVVDLWQGWAGACLAKDDYFTRERLAQCRELARAFDDEGNLDVAAFLRELDSHTVRETDAPGQIAVMTIHKAKGLDWDLVILPDLQGNSLTERRQGLAVKKDAEGRVEWLLQMPKKDFAQADPVLAEQIAQAEQDAAFEQLCLLYVAMTRARRGLYILTHPCEASKSKNFPKLLETALGAEPHDLRLGGELFRCAWEAGQAEWLETLPKNKAPDRSAEGEPDLLPESARSSATDLLPLTPSSLAPRPGSAALPLWIEFGEESRRLGTELHEALARLDWAEAKALSSAAFWKEREPELSEDAIRFLTATFALPEAAALLARPDKETRLLREMPFELVDGERWITGQSDRVLVEYDASGAPDKVTIVDFKTGANRDPALFSPQLGIYRRAYARLFAVPENAVEARLLFLSEDNPAVIKVAGDKL